MSWQLGILCLLGLTLLGGAAWYERSRPPSQIVSLVAALAALAVAGRIALSPIPNVVATTDIVLIAGLTLGAAPGFAVGALAALVSNFWLGQGPWTPWQMAAWGLVGIGGALIARIRGRELGRLELAAYCGAAGLAYGALLDFSLMVTYGGEQSLDRFLALSARGIPFNIAHAAGNVGFALIAGPALSRMLTRYRERFEFAWDPPSPTALHAAGAGCIALAIVAGGVSGLRADRASAGGATSAVAYLRSAQNDDGGFSVAPDSPSSLGMTGWAALGLESAGINPRDVRRQGKSSIDYLRDQSAPLREPGDLERTILVLVGAGVNPRSFGGQDLIAKLRAARGGDGSWSGQVNLTAFGILALAAAGEGRGDGESANWLAGARAGDGGWAFVAGADSGDADSTGAALQALAVTGGNRGAISSGVRWLRREQQRGGGFELAGGGVNAQSTAWAVQGLVSAGVDPGRVRSGGRSGLDYIASVRASDGHYRYSGSSDQTPVWVTAQAMMAAGHRSFPFPAVPRAAGGGGGGARAVSASGAGAGAPAASGKRTEGGKAVAPEQGATVGATADSEPGSAPAEAVVAPAAATQDGGSGDGGGALPWILAGGGAALAAVVWGGWVAYRRRLPAR